MKRDQSKLIAAGAPALPEGYFYSAVKMWEISTLTVYEVQIRRPFFYNLLSLKVASRRFDWWHDASINGKSNNINVGTMSGLAEACTVVYDAWADEVQAAGLMGEWR